MERFKDRLIPFADFGTKQGFSTYQPAAPLSGVNLFRNLLVYLALGN